MLNKSFWKFLLFISFSTILLLGLFKILPNKFPELNLYNESFASIFVSIIILLTLFYYFLKTHGVKAAMVKILIWKVIFYIIIICYAFRFELQYAGYRVLAVLIPSYSWTNEQGQIMISRSEDGHFYTSAQVNGIDIKFMIDTGASDVALTKEAAKALKFDLSTLKFSKVYSTANGISSAAPVILTRFKIGSKIFESVNAHVGSGDLDISLLGMSVIGRFKGFNIDKDILKLSY